MAAKTGTYTLIASTTLTSNQNSVTFSSIPQTYTDLVLIGNFWNGSLNNTDYFGFNNSTGTPYSITGISGNGTTAATFQLANNGDNWLGYSPYPGGPSTNPVSFKLDILDYSNTTTYKTSIVRTNNAGAAVWAIVSLWRNTAAISTIKLTTGDSYYAGSNFKLYGIEAGNQ